MTKWHTNILVLTGSVLVLLAVFITPRLDPDTDLYAAGSLGLFPSPLGRVAGLGGYWSLAFVAIVSALLLVFLARDTKAALLLVTSPAFVWCMFPGVDALGALLVVTAVGVGAVGRVRLSRLGRLFTRDASNESVRAARSPGLAPLPSGLLYPFHESRPLVSHATVATVLAPLAHASTLPLSLYLACRRSALVCAFVSIFGIALLPLTPYAIDLHATFQLSSLGYGLATCLLVGGPLVYCRRVPFFVPVAGCTVLAVALVQADDPGTVTRYALPLAAVLTITGRV